MGLLNYLFSPHRHSAAIAKERLKIVLAHERAGRAYLDAVARFLGETREMRFVKPERRNLFRVLFGRA